MKNNPARITPVSKSFYQKAVQLTEGVEVSDDEEMPVVKNWYRQLKPLEKKP
jgi:hypothetical protein